MEYIVSCSALMSDSPEEIADEVWYSVWGAELWPYFQVSPSDSVYFFEEPGNRLRWKVRISAVHRFAYSDKYVLRKKLRDRFPTAAVDVPAFEDLNDSGWCLAYRVEPLFSMNIPRPEGFVIPGMGWLTVDERVRREWALKE